MEKKTQVHAENGQQFLIITRDFDLPVDLLFTAYTDADIVAQWMNTKVVKLENKSHGGYQFETSDPKGNLVFKAHGAIHDIVTNQKITRTFEMENAPFGVQLEFLEFEQLTQATCRLSIRTVYRSVEQRDQMLQLPFRQGINMAHNRLQEIVKQLK